MMAYLEPYNENSHMFLLFLASYRGTWFNPSSEDEVGKLPPLVGVIKETCFPIFDPPPEHRGSLNDGGSIWGSTEP